MAVPETGDLEYKHVKYVFKEENENKIFFRSSEYFPHLYRFYPNLGLSEVCTDLSHGGFIGQESEIPHPNGILHYVHHLSLTISSIWNNQLIKTKSFACLTFFEMSVRYWLAFFLYRFAARPCMWCRSVWQSRTVHLVSGRGRHWGLTALAGSCPRPEDLPLDPHLFKVQPHSGNAMVGTMSATRSTLASWQWHTTD